MTSHSPQQTEYPHFHVLNKLVGDPIDCTWLVQNQGDEDVEVRLRIIFDNVGLALGAWGLLTIGSAVTPLLVSGTVPAGTLPGPHTGRLRIDARRPGMQGITIIRAHTFTVNVA